MTDTQLETTVATFYRWEIDRENFGKTRQKILDGLAKVGRDNNWNGYYPKFSVQCYDVGLSGDRMRETVQYDLLHGNGHTNFVAIYQNTLDNFNGASEYFSLIFARTNQLRPHMQKLIDEIGFVPNHQQLRLNDPAATYFTAFPFWLDKIRWPNKEIQFRKE